ncbi:EndoU domain-containing protein [Elusimicrobiota bacterium]
MTPGGETEETLPFRMYSLQCPDEDDELCRKDECDNGLMVCRLLLEEDILTQNLCNPSKAGCPYHSYAGQDDDNVYTYYFGNNACAGNWLINYYGDCARNFARDIEDKYESFLNLPIRSLPEILSDKTPEFLEQVERWVELRNSNVARYKHGCALIIYKALSGDLRSKNKIKDLDILLNEWKDTFEIEDPKANSIRKEHAKLGKSCIAEKSQVWEAFPEDKDTARTLEVLDFILNPLSKKELGMASPSENTKVPGVTTVELRGKSDGTIYKPDPKVTLNMDEVDIVTFAEMENMSPHFDSKGEELGRIGELYQRRIRKNHELLAEIKHATEGGEPILGTLDALISQAFWEQIETMTIVVVPKGYRSKAESIFLDGVEFYQDLNMAQASFVGDVYWDEYAAHKRNNNYSAATVAALKIAAGNIGGFFTSLGAGASNIPAGIFGGKTSPEAQGVAMVIAYTAAFAFAPGATSVVLLTGKSGDITYAKVKLDKDPTGWDMAELTLYALPLMCRGPMKPVCSRALAKLKRKPAAAPPSEPPPPALQVLAETEEVISTVKANGAAYKFKWQEVKGHIEGDINPHTPSGPKITGGCHTWQCLETYAELNPAFRGYLHTSPNGVQRITIENIKTVFNKKSRSMMNAKAKINPEYPAGGKVFFPKSWGSDKIRRAIIEILENPNSKVSSFGKDALKVEGTVDGVKITVLIKGDGAVGTAYPSWNQ